jgi:putative peptide maturation system protein
MCEEMRRTTGAVLDCLMALAAEGARPPEALARVRRLACQHPEARIDLVWEEQAYDRSVHYDALVRLAGGTVSLSWCPARARPWPLRGVRRCMDNHLLCVNDVVLDVEQAVACLDFIWEERPIIDRLVNVCLIQEELRRNPVVLSDEELQRAMDAFRRRHGLLTAEQTRHWLERKGMSQEALERRAADEATVAALRDRVAAGGVEAFFEAHRADFDTAHVACFDLADEEAARRTCEQVRGGELDFFGAAEQASLDAAARRRRLGPLFCLMRRGQVSEEMAEAVFTAAPGDLCGPVRAAAGYAILRVLSHAPARLDESARAAIKQLLMDRWLEERRAAATIEWYWGNAGGAAE